MAAKTRNIYRGSPEAYASDSLALGLAVAGLDNGHYAALTGFERFRYGGIAQAGAHIGTRERKQAQSDYGQAPGNGLLRSLCALTHMQLYA